MPREFNIPKIYRSDLITNIKKKRSEEDKRKEDRSPTILDLGKVRFKIARHFGFCFGVENAIEIAYKAVRENPDKRIFLLSEMIHNPKVNADLQSRGVRFLMSTKGEQLISFDELKSDDIVIVPAFGTTVELFNLLESKGIDAKVYNATCPFVERVWKRASELGKKGYTIVIHGKHDHEETRATFSHAKQFGPSIIVRDIEQAKLLANYISGEKDLASFYSDFGNLCSENFDPSVNLQKIGVVNQTTMLASETKEIASLIKGEVIEKYSEENVADTRDTLCYATYENQEAVKGLMESGGDIAIVVGGYNSSNTSHLVELLEEVVSTYYIKDSDEIESLELIRHLSLEDFKVKETVNWYPKNKEKMDILITAGASSPDAEVDQVIYKIASFLNLDQEFFSGDLN